MAKFLNIRNILVFIFVVFVLWWLMFREKNNTEKWSFVGYQYRWNENYVEHDGFGSERECVIFGNDWIEKQTSSEALFTCSLNTRPSGISGIDTADKVCEYGRSGFVRCRE